MGSRALGPPYAKHGCSLRRSSRRQGEVGTIAHFHQPVQSTAAGNRPRGSTAFGNSAVTKAVPSCALPPALQPVLKTRSCFSLVPATQQNAFSRGRLHSLCSTCTYVFHFTCGLVLLFYGLCTYVRGNGDRETDGKRTNMHVAAARHRECCVPIDQASPEYVLPLFHGRGNYLTVQLSLSHLMTPPN